LAYILLNLVFCTFWWYLINTMKIKNKGWGIAV
jgi:hypothetical protein